MKVVVYGADWCGPCRMVKGTLSRANVEFESINIEEEPNKAADAGIRGLPTIVVFDGDTEVKRLVGNSADLIVQLELLGVGVNS